MGQHAKAWVETQVKQGDALRKKAGRIEDEAMVEEKTRLAKAKDAESGEYVE